MGEFIAQDWDLSRPLWEMVLVENYRDDEGAECAVISRGYVRLLLFWITFVLRYHPAATIPSQTVKVTCLYSIPLFR